MKTNNTDTPIHGGTFKGGSRGYLSQIESFRIPNQQNDYTCGPACGVAELRKYGVTVTESELARLAGTINKYGTDPTDLALAINLKLPEHLNIEYRGGYLPTEKYDPEKMFDARTSDGPWLIQIDPGSGPHYIVIDKIESDIVTVLDPWRLKTPGPGNGLEATTTKQEIARAMEKRRLRTHFSNES